MLLRAPANREPDLEPDQKFIVSRRQENILPHRNMRIGEPSSLQLHTKEKPLVARTGA